MTKCVVAFSGKRKSGKDYCTKLLKNAIKRHNVKVAVTGISNSLKQEYARIHELDFDELLTDGPYKEQYRKEMIKWGEDVRSTDYTVFCRAAMRPFLTSEVVIVSDCRRFSDFRFFTENYNTLTIRVETESKIREQRGFQFVEGIDDKDSECGLDSYEFDVVLQNNTEEEDLTKQIESLAEKVMRILIAR